jgi:Xaa-Pro aminopeptidase
MLVTGAGVHNPALQYFTGGAHLSEATLVKPVNRPAVLFHISMERDEAAATGLATCDTATIPNKELLARAGGDRGLAAALRFQWMLQFAGINQGQVAIYGAGDIGRSFTVFSRLQQAAPDLTLVGFQENDFLSQAMMTKDAGEVERIRRMGKITTTVVGRVADFLSSRPVRGGILLGKDDHPLTIGEVKSLINLWLAELGAENPEGTIFSMGRDSAVPHSSGSANAMLKLGETIVFDIYPCERGGGYFYDFTRTWCLGYAPDEVLKLHEDVLAVYNRITEDLRLHEWFGKYQRQACELFEAQGHPTVLSNPRTERGYVHGLGHGVGLKVQERPHSGAATHPSDLLLPGVVITIEPGLYYPENGMGMRLENTLHAREDGSFEILADFPMDLILPVKISA